MGTLQQCALWSGGSLRRGKQVMRSRPIGGEIRRIWRIISMTHGNAIYMGANVYLQHKYFQDTVKHVTSKGVQMRRFIWNINMNPFPHLKTVYGRGPRSTDRLESIDWRQLPCERGPNSSNYPTAYGYLPLETTQILNVGSSSESVSTKYSL